MAERTHVVRVHVEYLTHDEGHWCNDCRLSTGLRIWATMRQESRMFLASKVYCYDCEGHNITTVTDDTAGA